MSLDDGWFLVRGCLLLGFTEFLDETHRAALETAVELAASTGMNELAMCG